MSYSSRAAATSTRSEGSYSIAILPADELIVATLIGTWTFEIIDRYQAALLSAGAQLIAAGVKPRRIGLLVDARTFSPQPQEVVAYYVRAFEDPRFQSDRIAVLYGSTLQKIQTRRMAVGNPHFFDDWDEAFLWLRTIQAPYLTVPQAAMTLAH